MTAKIYLKETQKLPGDSILQAGVLPIMRGEEDENLACGACKSIIFRGVSTRIVYERIRPENRLVVQCTCGAHNLLPSQPVDP